MSTVTTSPFCRLPIHLKKMRKLLIQIFKQVRASSALPLHIIKPVPGMYTLRKDQPFALGGSTILRPYKHARAPRRAHTRTPTLCSGSSHCSNLAFLWLPITQHDFSLCHEQHAAIHQGQRLTAWQC